MVLSEKHMKYLQTPCIVIDVEKVRKNINEMQEAISKTGCALRPHIKTHKMPLFSLMQINAGANGITCAKVSEAEVMADAGISDIFIAYPMVGEFRIIKAIELHKRIKRLILAVDSLEGARKLSELASKQGVELEVRIEIDTGAGRTGVLIENSAELAVQITKMKSIRLTGIYTFKGLIYEGKPTQSNMLAAQEEGKLLVDAAQRIKTAGVNITEISGGSSPTGVLLAQTGLVTEVRPGTYIFKDQLLCNEQVGLPQQIAAKYFATVVSTQHDEYAVIDGGTKTFATDVPLNAPPFYYTGYAQVENYPHLCLSRMNEEHGILTARCGKIELGVGDIISLVPIHICTAINQQNQVFLFENNELTLHKVDARGMTV